MRRRVSPDRELASERSNGVAPYQLRYVNFRTVRHAGAIPIVLHIQLNAMEANRDLYRRKSNRVLRLLEFGYDQAVAWREGVRCMVDNGLILVTGAAGQVGSVGRI